MSLLPMIPGGVSDLKINVTVEEALIILAAMIGINLGNGTLWGNGVQLGEKIKQITAVNSRNIGDLKIKEESAKATPGKYTFVTNKYALIPDLWTIADVYSLLGQVSKQIVAKAA